MRDRNSPKISRSPPLEPQHLLGELDIMLVRAESTTINATVKSHKIHVKCACDQYVIFQHSRDLRIQRVKSSK